MEDTAAPADNIAPLDVVSTVRAMRDMLQKRIESPVVPIGVEFLGTILGCLHLTTQLLDVLPPEAKREVVKTQGTQFTIGEMLLLSNVVLTMAGEKLDIPDKLKNV